MKKINVMGVALVFSTALLTLSSDCNAAEWIFDSSVIRSVKNPREALSLTDPYSASFIQKIFSSSEVQEHESVGGFISVKGISGNFMVGDGGNGKIAFIEGWNGDFEDVLGNKIGDPLLKAIGASVSMCNSGESLYCDSKIGPHLIYLISTCNSDGFPQDIARYEIKDCDRIEGFQLISR